MVVDVLEQSADVLLFGGERTSGEVKCARAEHHKRLGEAVAIAGRVEIFRTYEDKGLEEWAAESIASEEECSPRAAAERLAWSLKVHDDLPVCLELLKIAEIPVASVRAIADQAFLLDHAQCAALEERLWPEGVDTVPSATGKLPGALVRRCQHWIPRIVGGDTAELQTTAARQDRDVHLLPGQPGTDMALLQAAVTVPDGEAILAALNATADQAGPDDPRSRGALRADALVEAITGQPSFALWADSGMTDPLPIAKHWTVQVTVPLDVLAGTFTDPGVIARTPITSLTARLLAEQAIGAGGRIARLVTDPFSGALLDVTLQRQQRPPPPGGPPPEEPSDSLLEPGVGFRSEVQYEPSTALARFVRARDQRCQHPGCGLPASRCDLDHITPWPMGPTSAENLVALCRHHHRLKHSPGWSLTKTPDGTLEWTTPSGRTVRVGPPDPLG